MTKSMGAVAKNFSFRGVVAQSVMASHASRCKPPDASRIAAMTEDEKSKELNRLLEGVIGDGIAFEVGKFKFAQSGIQTLDNTVAILKVFPEQTIYVEGVVVDNIPNASVLSLPIELWQMRAFEIKKYLQTAGVTNKMVYQKSKS